MNIVCENPACLFVGVVMENPRGFPVDVMTCGVCTGPVSETDEAATPAEDVPVITEDDLEDMNGDGASSRPRAVPDVEVEAP